ncbi:MAG: RNA polymerase sigma factor RpoD/SigA [bacterium]
MRKQSKNENSITLEDIQSLRYYLDEIGNIPVLTRAEEMALVIHAKNGDQRAANKLICSNLRFVVRVAREYQDRGLPLVDLISEGNIGLIRALETFDHHKGLKFITYAVWWIRQAILQALSNKSRQIRLPQNRLRQLRETFGAVGLLEKNLERLPTAAEIDEVLGRNENIIWTLSKYLQTQQSLDAPLNHDSPSALINIIPNDSSLSPDADLNRDSLKKELNEALKVLTERERTILTLLYGLGTERPLNLGEVGNQFGISRERVRQIRNEALDKLRRTKRVQNTLRVFLG